MAGLELRGRGQNEIDADRDEGEDDVYQHPDTNGRIGPNAYRVLGFVSSDGLAAHFVRIPVI